MNDQQVSHIITDHLTVPLHTGHSKALRFNKQILVSVTKALERPVSPTALFGRAIDINKIRLFWARPSESLYLVGIGQTVSLDSHQLKPIEEIKQSYNALLLDAVIESPDVKGVGPIFLGGFSFDPDTPKETLWADFPNGRMILPQFVFSSSHDTHWLTISVLIQPGSDINEIKNQLISEVDLLFENLGPDFIPKESSMNPEILNQTSPEEWSDRVSQALHFVDSSDLEKVVLARKIELYSHTEFSPVSILIELCNSYPSCTIFALNSGDSHFLGASPEILVDLEGGSLQLLCLAGSIKRGNSALENASLAKILKSSAKDLREHSTVVKSISDSLQKLCADLYWDPSPSVLQLPNLQHLATSFSGNLKSDGNLFDLIQTLHPTPAVGGTPREKALALIRKLEGDRGWYAGPVGWIDHRGNGQSSVAIRSAITKGNYATLFAGSGIVAGSDANLEEQETELKFKPLLKALGMN